MTEVAAINTNRSTALGEVGRLGFSLKKAARRVEKSAKPFYAPAMMAAGAIAAPFTGGLSLALIAGAGVACGAAVKFRKASRAQKSAQHRAARESGFFASQEAEWVVPFPKTAQRVIIKKKRIPAWSWAALGLGGAALIITVGSR